MRSMKRKKLDILYRKLKKRYDPHSTYDAIQQLKVENKIRFLTGKRKRKLNIPKWL